MFRDLVYRIKMKTKIYDGTRGEKNLCHSCSLAVIQKGSALSQETIFCDYTRKELPFTVVECNQYDAVENVNLKNMREIAWTLEISKGRKVGFMTPEQRKEKEKEERSFHG